MQGPGLGGVKVKVQARTQQNAMPAVRLRLALLLGSLTGALSHAVDPLRQYELYGCVRHEDCAADGGSAFCSSPGPGAEDGFCTSCLDCDTHDPICAEPCARSLQARTHDAIAANATLRASRNRNDALQRRAALDHLTHALGAARDSDCTEREFDWASAGEAGSLQRASTMREMVRVFDKCRLLVLRNALSASDSAQMRGAVEQYIVRLANGTISAAGNSTTGETYFLHSLHDKRWEVLLPRELAMAALVMHPAALAVADAALSGAANATGAGAGADAGSGAGAVLHSFGSALAEPKCAAQRWHTDAPAPFVTEREDALKHTGQPPHDLPSMAMTVLAPVLDMRNEHGPTEFCVGSSRWYGLDRQRLSSDDVFRRQLRKNAEALDRNSGRAGSRITATETVDEMTKERCPRSMVRTPLLRLGDFAIFDYSLLHRGGENLSDELRTLLYITFSHPWFVDPNFRKLRRRNAHDSQGRELLFNNDGALEYLIEGVQFAADDE